MNEVRSRSNVLIIQREQLNLSLANQSKALIPCDTHQPCVQLCRMAVLLHRLIRLPQRLVYDVICILPVTEDSPRDTAQTGRLELQQLIQRATLMLPEAPH